MKIKNKVELHGISIVIDHGYVVLDWRKPNSISQNDMWNILKKRDENYT